MTRSIVSARAPLAGAALLLAAACADSPGAPRDAGPLGTPRASVGAPAGGAEEQDGYLVFLKPQQEGELRAAEATAADLAKVAGNAEAQALGFVDAVVLRGDVDVAALEADPRVERVAPNSMYYKLAYPTGATFYQRGWQWHMKQIRAEQAATAGAGRRVCIIDGGVNKNHQDLLGKVVAERSFPNPGQSWIPDLDTDSHGTHVGSTVSSNGIGAASVAPEAQLMNANVFGPNAGVSVAQVVDAMGWCSQNGADVINMSLGGARTRGTATWVADSTTYTNATQAARALGTVVIAAAGNSNTAIPGTGTGQAFLPAEATGVLAVGATSPPTNTTFPFATQAPSPLYDARAPYSNYNTGNEALGAGVDVYAPGGASTFRAQLNVTAACAPSAGPGCSDGRRYYAISGTSMASPHVAGLAALVSSRGAGARSLARVQAIESCILATSDALPGGTPFFGRGRINALRATTEPCPGLQ
jgi:subtilisin family serine protease